jgi:hypothetical protein
MDRFTAELVKAGVLVAGATLSEWPRIGVPANPGCSASWR